MVILNSHEPDECCGKHISKWLLTGSPFVIENAASWSCPECGTEWKPRVFAGGDDPNLIWDQAVRHWSPHPVVAIVR